MDSRHRKILEVAHALLASNGEDAAGASTGERIAGAIAAGRPQWAGYTDITGYTDVIGMMQRLGPEWTELVADVQPEVDRSLAK